MQLHPVHPLPLRAGAGFKPEHFEAIERDRGGVGFFEVHAENYMGEGGAPHATLRKLRADYPIFVHGVGLSIGGESSLDLDHLRRLKTVVDRYKPLIVSEHLAWSSHDTTYYNDLLPVPYTSARLDLVVNHIDQVQAFLGRNILLENPSTYVAFDQCDMDEIAFISDVAKRTGCGLLLDVNNVHVSATNHAMDASAYLHSFPLHLVQEIHLAGHATEEDDDGKPLLIDSHDRAVCAEVWRLYDQVIAIAGSIPTLIEWDNEVPAWNVLKHEAQLAEQVLNQKTRFKHAV